VKLGPLYHTGIILSLNAASLATVCTVLAFGEWSAGYFLMVFLITYAVYGLDRLTGIDEDLASQPERARFLKNWRRPFGASIALSFLGAFLLAAARGWVAALVPVAPAVIAAYSGNLSERVFHFRGPDLKRYFLVKDAAIASGWAFLLPLGALYLGRPMGTGAWIFLLPLFVKLFVMASIYDFKDIDSDRKAGVRTLPVVLGEKKSRAVLHVLNAAATAGMIALVAAGILPFVGLIFVPAFLYAAVLIHLSRRDAPGWVFFVVADLEQFFWLSCAGTWGWAAAAL
jgi:4-hydroxybenzoate polyprenyltransferase